MPIRLTRRCVRRLNPRSAQRKAARQRNLSPIAIDPVTRQIRRGSVTIDGDRILLRLPLRIPSPNDWLTSGPWYQSKVRKKWKIALLTLLAESAGRLSTGGIEPPCRLLGLEPCTERRTLHIQRLVASRSSLVADDDNLAFTTKHIRDRLVKFGFLKDDRREWLRASVGQAVSPDKLDWTEIAISPWPDAARTLAGGQP